MESPTIGKLSSMYMYAWKRGIKTTYYLRSRPATKINQVSAQLPNATQEPAGSAMGRAGAEGATESAKAAAYSEAEAIACSLENPGACEACQ
jgi:ribonucleoside-diphosphate reductase alpha chain